MNILITRYRKFHQYLHSAWLQKISITMMAFALMQATPAVAQGIDGTWKTKNAAELRTVMTEMYNQMFSKQSPQVIPQLFSPHYIQVTDGKTISYKDFLTHIQLLYKETKSIRVEVLDAAYTGDTLADRHLVHVVKADGSQAEFEVLAFLRIKDNKIQILHEMSRQIKGNTSDKDLGSRTQ